MFGSFEEKLLNLHTAFIGIVVSMNGDSKAKVQPLNMIQPIDGKPIKRAVLVDVPVLKHVRHFTVYENDGHGGHVKMTPLEAGDLVFCVCSERDISETRKGKSVVPTIGHHEIKDAVVVGLL